MNLCELRAQGVMKSGAKRSADREERRLRARSGDFRIADPPSAAEQPHDFANKPEFSAVLSRMNNQNRISLSSFAVLTAALLGLLGPASTTAYAAKMLASVTPESLQAHGFSMRTENRKDGTVEFTLIRDLARAKSFPADSGLQVARSATLRVVAESGFCAECGVAPNTRNPQNAIAYRFTLTRACIAHSRFTLVEDDDYRGQTREHLIGGGTHYEFDLSLFAKPSDDTAP